MDGWNVIWSSWNIQDIYMARSYLEANGIECLLQDELTTQTSYYANAIGGAKLLVRERDAREAARLLVEGGYVDEEDCDPGEDVVSVPETAATDKKRCPFCGSGNIGRERQTDVAMAIVGAVFQWLFPLLRRPYKCFDCGKAWRYVKAPRRR